MVNGVSIFWRFQKCFMVVSMLLKICFNKCFDGAFRILKRSNKEVLSDLKHF